LPYRWLIKLVIPASFVFLIVSATGFIIHNINVLRGVAGVLVTDERRPLV
jgi:TRAP-type mannitol/chloroaromatic compound transport system permease small subunit